MFDLHFGFYIKLDVHIQVLRSIGLRGGKQTKIMILLLKKCLNPNGLVYIDIINTESEHFVDYFYGESFQKQIKEFKEVYNTSEIQASTKTLYSPLPLSRVEELVGKLGFSLIDTSPAYDKPTTGLLFQLRSDK